jgi:hypothetical protein
MKNAVIIGLLSMLALAVVGTVGSVATPASASILMDGDKEILKCKVLDGEKDYDKYSDDDYIKLKCKIKDGGGDAPDED